PSSRRTGRDSRSAWPEYTPPPTTPAPLPLGPTAYVRTPLTCLTAQSVRTSLSINRYGAFHPRMRCAGVGEDARGIEFQRRRRPGRHAARIERAVAGRDRVRLGAHIGPGHRLAGRDVDGETPGVDV